MANPYARSGLGANSRRDPGQPRPLTISPRLEQPLNPDLLPRVYAATGKGDCLEPIYHDGCCLVFDRLAQCLPGDIVAVWLRPEIVMPGSPQQIVKRLVWRYGGTVVVEMLNPPRIFTFRSEDVLAMHKCLGEGESDGHGRARVRRSLLAPEALEACYA